MNIQYASREYKDYCNYHGYYDFVKMYERIDDNTFVAIVLENNTTYNKDDGEVVDKEPLFVLVHITYYDECVREEFSSNSYLEVMEMYHKLHDIDFDDEKVVSEEFMEWLGEEDYEEEYL